jgi:hypothetical protein
VCAMYAVCVCYLLWCIYKWRCYTLYTTTMHYVLWTIHYILYTIYYIHYEYTLFILLLYTIYCYILILYNNTIFYLTLYNYILYTYLPNIYILYTYSHTYTIYTGAAVPGGEPRAANAHRVHALRLRGGRAGTSVSVGVYVCMYVSIGI